MTDSAQTYWGGNRVPESSSQGSAHTRPVPGRPHSAEPLCEASHRAPATPALGELWQLRVGHHLGHSLSHWILSPGCRLPRGLFSG